MLSMDESRRIFLLIRPRRAALCLPVSSLSSASSNATCVKGCNIVSMYARSLVGTQRKMMGGGRKENVRVKQTKEGVAGRVGVCPMRGWLCMCSSRRNLPIYRRQRLVRLPMRMPFGVGAARVAGLADVEQACGGRTAAHVPAGSVARTLACTRVRYTVVGWNMRGYTQRHARSKTHRCAYVTHSICQSHAGGGGYLFSRRCCAPWSSSPTSATGR